MTIIGIILCAVGLGFICWLLFTLTVYALPFFAGVTAAFAAYHSGAGAVGSILVGVLTGGAVLAIGQILFATIRAPILRVAIALLYALPAAFAGYHATLGLAEIGMSSDRWREAFAIMGAILVGMTAATRMALLVPVTRGQGEAATSADLPLTAATRDG